MTFSALLRGAVALALGIMLTGCGNADSGAKAEGSEGKTGSPKPLTEEDYVQRLTDAYLDKGSAHVTYESQSQGHEYQAEGDMEFAEDNDDLKVSGTAKVPGGEFDVRVLNGAVFIGADGGKKFIKADLSDKKDPRVQTVRMIAMTVHDINGTLKRMDDMKTNFDKSGDPEELDDTDVQPYEIDIQEPGQDSSAEITYTYTLYVDAEDLIRRVEVANDGDDTTLSWEYSDWGDPVTVEKPDSSQLITKRSRK